MEEPEQYLFIWKSSTSNYIVIADNMEQAKHRLLLNTGLLKHAERTLKNLFHYSNCEVIPLWQVKINGTITGLCPNFKA